MRYNGKTEGGMRLFLTAVHLIVSGAVLFILFPVVALYLDEKIDLPSFSSFGFQLAGGVLSLIGVFLAISASYLLGVRGRGTPNPLRKTETLVRVGIYRYMRNPMLSGAILISLGSFLFLGSPSLLFIASGIIVVSFLYLHLYEEPELEKRFGEDYRRYKMKVPRFIPKLSLLAQKTKEV
jgi:protein-S-isoprenylcysteine O-methyltransferase Ste14